VTVHPLRPSEAQVQATLVDAARLHGYMVAHFRPAQTGRGWRTPVEGDAGFPDLVLARAGTVFAFEVKGPKGQPSYEQLCWQAALGVGSPATLRAAIVTPDRLDAALRALEAGAVEGDPWP
jgi:hypothetical protein